MFSDPITTGLTLKIVVVLFLLFILGSLASALYYVIKDKGNGIRAVKSLTLRVGLSVFLFAMLMLGTYLGFIPLSH
ncbi:twin transmembrane helix small protein [Nitrosospira sp. Nsp1]|uniref:twin transmembrane helix small protein n=1 Tax=Nitrosospira sp. Nsp1 TaxID=136547 RepID=UPI003525C3C1